MSNADPYGDFKQSGFGAGAEARNEISRVPQQPTEAKFAKTINANADTINMPPCFLPQPGDELPSKDHLEPLGPVGPWATGKVDWSPMSGLTGTRPCVDRYTITRFSPNEWRARNMELYNKTNKIFDKCVKAHYDANTTFTKIAAQIEKSQKESTKSLSQRVKVVSKWKSSLETAIATLAEEITKLEEERNRLKKGLVVLGIPEAIAKECIQKRSGRPDTELVRDQAEEELVRELALIAEIRRLMKKTLQDFEQQQVENRTARQRLEYDWSDKREAFEIDNFNVNLNSKSKDIMFRPGAMRQPAEQSSEHYWEQYSKETLEECERTRAKSVVLRQNLSEMFVNSARDIRTQADEVEKAFVARINCTQENLRRFENDLKTCLQKVAEMEHGIERLKVAVRSFDSAMKLAQTRMENHNMRPNVENCRDAPQQDLINEVHLIQSGVSAILTDLDEAERVKNELINQRNDLEHEIMVKRRALMLDREQCMQLRSHYPSIEAISGSGM